MAVLGRWFWRKRTQPSIYSIKLHIKNADQAANAPTNGRVKARSGLEEEFILMGRWRETRGKI